MENNYSLNAQDGFYLTFLGAWSSVRQELWVKDPWNMIILILAILSYARIITQIRHLLTPNESDKNKNRSISYFSIMGIIILVAVLCYFLWNANTYLLKSDIIILGATAVLWLIEPFAAVLDMCTGLVNQKMNNQSL